MSDNKTDAWKTFKTNIARTKHRVLAKVGAAETTIDSKIQAEQDKLFTLFKLVKRLNKSVDKYMEIMKNIMIVQNEMAHDIYSFDEKDPNNNAYQECQRAIERQRLQMEEYLETYYHDPLRIYISQFKEIEERLAELEIRRVDMDRYFRDYSVKANKGKEAASLSKTEAKHQKTKEGYQALSDELMRDMPILFNDRQSVFDPAFAAFINQNSQFFNVTSQAYNNILPRVQNTNEYNAVNHPWVITPVEQSAMSKNVRSSSVFSTNSSHGSPSTTSRPRASTVGGPLSRQPSNEFGGGNNYEQEYKPTPTSTDDYGQNYGQQSQVSLEKKPQVYSPPPQQQPVQSPPPTFTYQPPQQTTSHNQTYQPTQYSPPNNAINSNNRKSFSPTYSPPLQSTAGSQPISTGGTFTPIGGTTSPTGAPKSPMGKIPAGPRANEGRALPQPKPKGPMGEAIYDFAGEDGELTFKKGDKITLHTTTGDWLEGELNGVKGLVPFNYVKIL